MVKVFRVLITGVVSASASAVMAAAPAQADEATYLHRLQPTYTSLSTRQLLAEGYRVCKAERGGMNSAADAVLGGWQLAGLFRWTSGFPFTIGPGLGFWGTNWQLTSEGILTGKVPKTGRFVDKDGDPNVFQNGPNASNAFRIAFPGESGQRNNLRGPGFLNTDMSLTKQWKITESQNLKFSWEVFNLFNNVRFDVATMAATNGSFAANASQFGKFTKTLSTPRLMEFMLRAAP